MTALHIFQSPPESQETTDSTADASLTVDDLGDLMQSFTSATEQLQSTHTMLQDQVARLQTELAEANAQLRRSRSLAALGEMAAGIAHELRNPLGSIALYVQLLRDELGDQPSQEAMCEKISRGVDRLDTIVNDVLAFARDTRLNVAETNAAELINKSLADCEALFNASQIEVRMNTADTDNQSMTADTTLLIQAISNLFRNAIEAMADQPQASRVLKISADRMRCLIPEGERASRTRIAVEDSGPGIEEKTRQRMFNPFFTTRHAGAGLGLAIVHRIIDAHGGHIQVSNVPEGGARIELYLPDEPPAETIESGEPGDDEGVSLDQAVIHRIQRKAIA